MAGPIIAAAVPTILQILLRLAPWIGAWLVIDEVEQITSEVTDPESGPVGQATGAAFALGTVALVAFGAWLLLGGRKS